jgi:hypothetical protein
MSNLLTGETDVFAAAPGAGGRCAVLFLASYLPQEPRIFTADHARALDHEIDSLAAEGWLLSVARMVDERRAEIPSAFSTGFAHDVDVAGVFEAPSVGAALEGTVRIERAGWARRFATRWMIGPREFASVKGSGPEIERPWGFIALWEWNDNWAAATAEQRREYDIECDIAFKGDLALNVNITGRHRFDWSGSWHHLGVWESGSPEAVNDAITGHERVADFKFTTSRHYLGLRRPLAELIRYPSGVKT